MYVYYNKNLFFFSYMEQIKANIEKIEAEMKRT